MATLAVKCKTKPEHTTQHDIECVLAVGIEDGGAVPEPGWNDQMTVIQNEEILYTLTKSVPLGSARQNNIFRVSSGPFDDSFQTGPGRLLLTLIRPDGAVVDAQTHFVSE